MVGSARMAKVRLVHWHAVEARHKAELLRDSGYVVQHLAPRSVTLLRELRDNLPDAVVIDLSHLPTQGRAFALALRSQRSTRQVPVVFVAGSPTVRDALEPEFPDATFALWTRIRGALRRAISAPKQVPDHAESPADAPAPRANHIATRVRTSTGYSSATLPEKLGIKPRTVVALVAAPDNFERTLGELPADVIVRRHNRGPRDLTIWFVYSLAQLQQRAAKIVAALGPHGLWIAWPKRTSTLASDVRDSHVREAGLALGVVDYKVCAIDDDWSALKFARRRG